MSFSAWLAETGRAAVRAGPAVSSTSFETGLDGDLLAETGFEADGRCTLGWRAGLEGADGMVCDDREEQSRGGGRSPRRDLEVRGVSRIGTVTRLKRVLSRAEKFEVSGDTRSSNFDSRSFIIYSQPTNRMLLFFPPCVTFLRI